MAIKTFDENILRVSAFITRDIVFHMLEMYCVCSLSYASGSFAVHRAANKRLLLTVQSKYKVLTAFKRVKMFNLFLISILVLNL